MRRHHTFNFIWVDVETRHQDHVFLAVNNVEIAFFIHFRHVAGAQPAVFGQHLSGLFRPLPITIHHLRAFNTQFAGFTHRHGLAVLINDLTRRR